MRIQIPVTTTFHIHDEEPVFTSGVVCRLLHIPIWVLKQLDREKIIRPTRAKGKARLYSKKELDQLKYVWYLMAERDVKIGGLRVILEMHQGDFRSE